MAVRELGVPPEAAAARRADEVLRGWVIDRRLVCSLLPGAFEDPRGWGILLADEANHVANALAESGSADRGAVLRAVAAAFNSEMASPTDEHSGQFVGVTPLSDDERAVADRAVRFLDESMGTEGGPALGQVPDLWLAVAAVGLGAVQACAGALLDDRRTFAIELEVFGRLGMPPSQAAAMAQWLHDHQEDAPTRAMIGEGERAVTAWRSGEPVPSRLGELLGQMRQMAQDRGQGGGDG
jgi:hypothetical protein